MAKPFCFNTKVKYLTWFSDMTSSCPTLSLAYDFNLCYLRFCDNIIFTTVHHVAPAFVFQCVKLEFWTSDAKTETLAAVGAAV